MILFIGIKLENSMINRIYYYFLYNILILLSSKLEMK